MPDENIVTRWRSWTPQLLSVLRIVAAFLFIQFGTAKLFAMPGPFIPGGGTSLWALSPESPASSSPSAALLLLLGLFTRPVAFLVSGEMAIAYFQGTHRTASGPC